MGVCVVRVRACGVCMGVCVCVCVVLARVRACVRASGLWCKCVCVCCACVCMGVVHLCVCVCACVACVYACVRVRVCVCACVACVFSSFTDVLNHQKVLPSPFDVAAVFVLLLCASAAAVISSASEIKILITCAPALLTPQRLKYRRVHVELGVADVTSSLRLQHVVSP